MCKSKYRKIKLDLRLPNVIVVLKICKKHFKKADFAMVLETGWMHFVF